MTRVLAGTRWPWSAAPPPAPIDRRMLLPPVILLISAVVGPLAAASRQRVLPSRFLLDGAFIQQIAQHPADYPAAGSYLFTAEVYRALGLADDAQLAGIVSFLVVLLCYGVLLHGLRRTAVGVDAVALLILGLGLSCVYLGGYSKDVIALLVPTLLIAVPEQRRGLLVSTAAAVAYGLLAREYWLVIAAAYLGLGLLFERIRPTLRRSMGSAAAVTLLLSVAVAVVLHLDPGELRFDLNADRVGSADASTLIHPFLPGQGLLVGTLNNLLTLGSLIVPIPLALLGAGYAALAVVILGVWVLFGRALHRLGRDPARSPSTVRAAMFVVVFVAVQAGFEPDYGSYLRHLTIVVPLMVLVCGRTRPARPVPVPDGPRTAVRGAAVRGAAEERP